MSAIEGHIAVHNVAKRQNMGRMMRSACAFGFSSFAVVGGGHQQLFGAKGTHKYVPLDRFDSLETMRDYYHDRGCAICGVEITTDAAPVQSHPFRGSTVFIMGNEGDGMSEEEKSICDHFVYIPHFGNGTASLNVTVAASVVMYNFALWAGWPERPREAGRDKFVVDPPEDPATRPLRERELQLRRDRESRREAALGAGEDATAAAAGLFRGTSEATSSESDTDEV